MMVPSVIASSSVMKMDAMVLTFLRMYGILSSVLRVPQSLRSKKARLCRMRRREYWMLKVRGYGLKVNDPWLKKC